MSPRRADPSRSAGPRSGRELRFFLSNAPHEGRATLLAKEGEHALRVLRLAPDDRIVGLDGRGGAWPLRIVSAEQGRVAVEVEGPPRTVPPPGEPGAPLPWIEVFVPWPKGGRAEEMLDRATQLGVAAVAALDCERAQRIPGELSHGHRDRFERVLREACKQCGQSWLPALRESATIAAATSPGTSIVLDKDATTTLARWARERAERGEASWSSARPLRVFVGPEGGFTPEERAELAGNGAISVSLGPHVLRVETAAEAAVAVLAAVLLRDPGS